MALILLYTGCSTVRREETIATPTSFVSLPTLPATGTPSAEATDSPQPAQPTTTEVKVVDGVTSTQINVRGEPSTAAQVLGIIPANTRVEIVGKDPGGHWWQIQYAEGTDGKGWVTAKYVTTANPAEVPVIGGSAADPNQTNVAIVQQQINVRSGPGTDFNSLGTLNPQDVVRLVGKDANGAWLQISFEAGPQGTGWVNSAFVQARGVEDLPIVGETGQIVGTGTPTALPLTPTPTLVPAWDDQDSAIDPGASVIFEPGGTETLIASGDISSPQGDVEDWIAFQSDTSMIFIGLECKGNSALNVEMTEDNLPVRLDLSCGDPTQPIPVRAGSHYLIHLRARPSPGALEYTRYVLTIGTRPL